MLISLLLAAATLLACNSPTASTAAEDCEALSEAACIASSACTLFLDEASKGYLCRDSLDDCELDFRQAVDGAEECEAVDGCSFVPGQCYCSPGLTCICGGGPPPQCSLI